MTNLRRNLILSLVILLSFAGCKSNQIGNVNVTIYAPKAWEKVYNPKAGDVVVLNGEVINEKVWVITPESFNRIVDEINKKYKEIIND